MPVVSVSHDWPSYLDGLDRALGRFDNDPSVFGDELWMLDEIFVDAPLSSLPASVSERARVVLARVDRAVELVLSEMRRVVDRLTVTGDEYRDNRTNAPAVYIDEKF